MARHKKHNADADGEQPILTENAEAAEAADKKAEREEERKKAAKETLEALREITSDEDRPSPSALRKLSLSAILGGDILGGKWFRKQFWFLMMIVVMLIIYVSNRYSCQQEMIERKALTDTLLDRRYKALTRSAELKERTRRSNIEQSLTDTALQTPSTPLFNLNVEEGDN